MKAFCDERLTMGWVTGKVHSKAWTATLFAKATFRLEPGRVVWADEPEPLSGERFEGDDPAQAVVYPTDFAPFKPRADVIVNAVAHAPGGRPVPQFEVRLKVGGMTKALAAVGPRTWTARLLGGADISAPAPFTSVPVSFANAFGSPSDKRNPLGRGRGSEAAPLIEDPARRAAGPRDDAPPAGFSAIAPSWQSRASLVGTYDAAWRKERWPWFPRDFDWGFFNSAPRDQQIDGYLKGDEPIELENLHAEHALLRTALPALRVRTFLKERGAGGEIRFREAPLQLDTLWIDVPEGKLVLVWRGLAEVRGPKMREIENILTVLEPLGEAPRPLPDYEEELARRLAPPPDSPEEIRLAAESDAAEKVARANGAQLEKDALAMQAQAEALGAELDAIEAAEKVKHLASFDPKAVNLPEMPPLPPAAALAELAASFAGLPELPSNQLPSAADFDFGEFQAMAADLAAQPESTELTRADIQLALEQKLPMSRWDLSEMDLVGLDFSGVDLSESRLAGANLSNAIFEGANLTSVDATEANFTGANLHGAVLTQADFSKAVFAKANLKDTILDQALFNDIAFGAADFSGCRGHGTDFAGSDLGGANFENTRFPQANFSRCKLAKAVFAGAELPAARFDEAQGPGINFERANLTGLHGGEGANFSGGNFQRARADGAIFEGSNLDKADFSRALLNKALCGEASFVEARLDRVHAAGAVFDDAVLTRALLTNANFLRASFDRADLTEAKLTGSNFYEAGFWDALLEKADFDKANIKGTALAT